MSDDFLGLGLFSNEDDVSFSIDNSSEESYLDYYLDDVVEESLQEAEYTAENYVKRKAVSGIMGLFSDEDNEDLDLESFDNIISSLKNVPLTNEQLMEIIEICNNQMTDED